MLAPTFFTFLYPSYSDVPCRTYNYLQVWLEQRWIRVAELQWQTHQNAEISLLHSTIEETPVMDGDPDVLLPPELQNLSNLLEEFPETLALVGNQELQAAALNATKYVFDLCKLWIELY